VAHQIRGSILRRLKEQREVLPEIDGRPDTKQDVIRALLSGTHLYLVSEEGTGKTRLARSLTGLLPAIPVIAGCPYHDDPKWPRELRCPRCAASSDPVKDFGIDFLPGNKRFSRIQGNEYTNEAKLLGLKDIQAIAHGRSPQDPEVFTGTGVFKANRGILFVDEMPSIRTKVQVLFHPILEEKKAILEEYNWEHPLDLILVATGNPKGFSHVNEIPRPLLDRLEMIYMELPEESVEQEIILKEAFRVSPKENAYLSPDNNLPAFPEDIERRVAVPWWIMELIAHSVRYSRTCPYVENKASIRATTRALEHTYASVEIENGKVANLRHAYYGLRLSLRGRLELRADIVDFDDSSKAVRTADALVADFMWNVIEDIRDEWTFMAGTNWTKLGQELGILFAGGIVTEGNVSDAALFNFPVLHKAINSFYRVGLDRINPALLNDSERNLYNDKGGLTRGECNYSALETLANITAHQCVFPAASLGKIFLADRFKNP
jgi:MoxR-like ATPase